MRLLLLSHVPNDPDAGASRAYHMLADGLRGRGHSVTMRHLEDVRTPEYARLNLLARRTVMPQLVSRSASRLDLRDFDVVMSSSGMGYPLFRRLQTVPREGRPALINHVHGLTFYDHAASLFDHYTGQRRAALLNRLITGPMQARWDERGIATADVTVVQNLRDLSWIQSAFPEAEVRRIPLAVHPELLEASLAAEATEAAADKPRSGLLWFGTWEPRKGAAYVPSAFRAVRQRFPEVRLTVGGASGSRTEVLEAFDPRDRHAVEVLPRVSVEEQVEVYARHSIFLFPSLSEGFGLALVEAMAFGLASVTTNTAFGGDFVRDGVTGRIVAPTSVHIASAVVELLADPERTEEIGRAGQRLARTFTRDRMVEQYEALFDSLLTAR